MTDAASSAAASFPELPAMGATGNTASITPAEKNTPSAYERFLSLKSKGQRVVYRDGKVWTGYCTAEIEVKE